MSAKSELSQPPTVKAGMLVRRPPGPCFAALTDPTITTRFWFTKSTGRLAPGAKVRWEWEPYDVSAEVWVKEFEQDRRIVFDWGSKDSATRVEIRFIAWKDDTTYVQVTETGFRGSGDEMVAGALDSTGGWTMVLAALKALLEYDIVLTVVMDYRPAGLEF